MVQALLITGDTYTSRREIKALGGKWNPEESGWLLPVSDAARQFAEIKGFNLSDIEVDPILLEHPTGDRLRAIRQAKLDRRSEQRLARAERLEKKASETMKSVQPYMNMEFLTEPIKIGHHSEKRHRNLRRRIYEKIDKKFSLLSEADNLRKLAEPQKARIAGDAARRDQSQRNVNDSVVSIGCRVHSPSFGDGTIMKIFKKSYSVRFDKSNAGAESYTVTLDKKYLRPL